MKNTETIKLPNEVHNANWRDDIDDIDDIAVEDAELPFEIFENETGRGRINKKEGDVDKIELFRKRKLARKLMSLAEG